PRRAVEDASPISARLVATERRANAARDLQIFARFDDERSDRGLRHADLGVERRRVVPSGVERDAEEAKTGYGSAADRCGALANAAGEDERVEPAHRGGH